MNNTFTENINIDILLELDDKQLGITCQVNKYLYSLCNNYFWSLKLNKLYPGLNIPIKYKNNIKQFYIEISLFIDDFNIEISLFINDINKLKSFAIKKGYLEVLEWLAEHNIFPDIMNANWAAMNGYLEILKWISEKYNIFPNIFGINMASGNGHIEVLKWLAEYDIFPDENDASYAALNGHHDSSRCKMVSSI